MKVGGRLGTIAAGFGVLAMSVSACGLEPGGSAASCSGGILDDQPPSGTYGAPPPTYAPGDSFVVHGSWFTSTCNDTGGHLPLRPLRAVHLSLRLADGTTIPLGTGTPHGHDMGFSVPVTVPQDAATGPAAVIDDNVSPHTFRLEIARPH